MNKEVNNIFPTEALIKKNLGNGLNKDSKIICDSPFTWNKGIRFKEKLGIINQEIMLKVKKTWQITFFNEKNR